MSKITRVKWFKIKLLCRKLSIEEVAKELNITKKELILLIKDKKQDSYFTKWVVENLGKPYWL
ncbi:MAG: hypothetical protein WCK67_11085 [bacterium]